MFGLIRWSPFEEFFTFQREVDRLFNRFWSDLPARTAAKSPGSFQVKHDRPRLANQRAAARTPGRVA